MASAPPALTGLPVRSFDEVYHVGSMNHTDRKTASYEGDGLSVSVNPEEWSHIARLGGPTWALRNPDSSQLQFADYRAMSDTDIAALQAWAFEQGWMEQRTVYAVTWFDDEWDEEVHMEFATESEARAEAECKVEDEEIDAHVIPHVEWRPTRAFPEQRIDSEGDPTDLLLAVYVRQARPDLDGVWWDDTFAPERYSCPRGVIVGDLSRYVLHECS